MAAAMRHGRSVRSILVYCLAGFVIAILSPYFIAGSASTSFARNNKDATWCQDPFRVMIWSAWRHVTYDTIVAHDNIVDEHTIVNEINRDLYLEVAASDIRSYGPIPSPWGEILNTHWQNVRGGEIMYVRGVAYGFPFRSHYVLIVLHSVSGDFIIVDGLSTKSFDTRAYYPEGMVVPLGILVYGLIINSIICAAMIFCVHVSVWCAIYYARVACNQCIECGYPGAVGTCPECGSALISSA